MSSGQPRAAGTRLGDAWPQAAGAICRDSARATHGHRRRAVRPAGGAQAGGATWTGAGRRMNSTRQGADLPLKSGPLCNKSHAIFLKFKSLKYYLKFCSI